MFRQFNYDTFHLIIILLTLLPNGQAQNSSSAPWESLPDMDIFCPGADVCREHSSGPKQNVTFREGFTSCCRECSCAATCGSTSTCCFPAQDAQAIGQVDRNRQQCVVASTEKIPDNLKYKYNAYFMVAASPPGGCKEDANVTNGKQLLDDACGEQPVTAPWGSLLPVYSKRTGLIYTNSRCAKCHGISDGIVWKSLLLCQRFDVDNKRERSMASYMQHLENTLNTSQSHCSIRFIYPGASTDIENEICFVNVTNSCSGTNFNIADNVNITQADVIKACDSGLFSPYRKSAKSVYSNVFCSICNGEIFRKDQICFSPALYKWNPQRGNTGHFVALLDSKYIESLEKADKAYIDSPVVCRIDGISVNKTNCRILQCPSGQFRFQDGACEYPSDTWYDQTIAVYLQLFPEAQIRLSSFIEQFAIDSSRITNDRNMEIAMSCLKSRWPKKWRVDRMFYNLKTDSSIINEFVVLMACTLLNDSPQKIIESIKQHIPKLWTITLNDTVIELVPKVAEYQTLVTRVDKMIPLWAANIEEEIVPQFLLKNRTVPNLEFVFIKANFIEYIMITKTFFCQQVQLKSNEFDFYANSAIVYYKEMDTLLFDGEFEIVYDDEGNYVPRICLEDARFKEITKVFSANKYDIAKGRIGYAVCLLAALRWFLDAFD